MKAKYLIINALILLFAIQSNAQTIIEDSSVQLYQEKLPLISIRKNVPLFTISIITGYYLLGANANEYHIGNRSFLSSKKLKPVLSILNDSEVDNLYTSHRNLKPVSLGLTSLGLVVYIGGIAKSYSTVYNIQANNETKSGVDELIVSGGILFIAGVITRIISFSNLHKSVNRYNQLRNPVNLGISSSGIGIGLTINF